MTDTADSHYNDLWIHRAMLQDGVRCGTYHQAIVETVRAGDVVLDMGAGTGILSLFAVQVGARKVYAVERTGIVELARRLVDANGAGDRVEVLHGDVEAIELPERVDVLVSEWMGGHGVDENFLLPLLIARDRWLKPGGRILPGRVTAWMAPAWDGELAEDLGFWRDHPYDVDLSLIAEATTQELFWCRHHVGARDLLAEPQAMWTTDIYTCRPEQAGSPFRASLSFPVSRQGRCNALATWFHAEFDGGLALTNAPGAAKTHWGRFVFPLDDTHEVKPGDTISAELVCEPAGVGRSRHRWSVRLGEGAWEHHESGV